MNPQTYMTADPMHLTEQKCVSLPTSIVGKGSLPATSFNFILIAILALLGTRILNTYPDPQTYVILDPMHLTKQKCVSLPTSGVGKGISSGNFLQFYFYCHNGSPGNTHSEYVSGSTNLRDTGPYAPDQEEVCILTDFLVWEKESLPATFFNFI
jgi:hypothetical protein